MLIKRQHEKILNGNYVQASLRQDKIAGKSDEV